MSKYPLDAKAIEEISGDILQHNRAQITLIADLAELLRTAMECVDEDDADDNPWLEDANTMLSKLSSRRIEFENHRFNQKNGHSVGQRSPYSALEHERIGTIDLKKEAELNTMEASNFGEEMSAEEVAQLFNAPVVRPKKKKMKKLSKMSLEEIESWEAAQDNSNDIYKVSARIKNLARGAVKGNLTAQGDMVCNTFTHTLKVLYDFASTVEDKSLKMRLTEIIKNQEQAPANLIAALGAGVRLS